MVEDDGQGIPIGLHEKRIAETGRDVSALSRMTILHAGGKFDKIPTKFLVVAWRWRLFV
jgi:DNA gyrase/topoisomerase IV subunit B